MIRRTAMLGVAALMLLTATPALSVDRVVLAEMFGGTWCGYCPEAHAALQVLSDECGDCQLAALYYHVGPDPFTTSESTARASWYTVGGVPHVRFDGTDPCIGVYEDLELTTDWYRGIIQTHRTDLPPLEIRPVGHIQSDSGYVTVDFVARASVGYSSIRAQFLLVEGGCEYNSNVYDFTVRDVLPTETLTLSSPGDSVQVTRNFTIDGGWNYQNMHVVVFVEDTTLKEIVQASIMPPAYDLHMSSPVYAEEIDYYGEAVYTTYVENRGTATDTVTVDIAQAELPEGVSEWSWFAQYCGTNGICYFGPSQFVLAPGDVDTFYVHMGDYLGNVQGRAVTNLTVQSGGEPSLLLTESFGTFVDLPPVLLVDDDGGTSYQTYLETALADTGYPAMTWDVYARGRPSQELVNSFWATFWTTAASNGTQITLADEAVMANYLDGGGNLFITSMEYLSSRVAMTPFINNYLHIDSWSSDVGGLTMTGVSGDAISDGMALGLVGGPVPSADCDSFVTDGGVDVTFTSLSTERGMKVEEDGHKVAFISFPFEDVKVVNPYPDNQKTLARRIIEWFLAESGVVDGDGDEFAKLSLEQNRPNPFNPVTTIAFTVPSGAEHVSLAVYNVSGRLVRSLVDGAMTPGPHSIAWNGRDDEGRSVSSGVYFARLSADRETSSVKMTLLK